MVIPVLDPATGGPPGIAAAQAVALQQLGTTAHIACYTGWKQDTSGHERATAMLQATAHEASAHRPSPLATPKVIPLGPLDWPETLFASRAKEQLRDLLSSRAYDIVQFHGVWDPLIMWAAKLCRELSIPYVITAHGMLEPWALRKRFKKELFWRLGWSSALTRAAALHEHHAGPVIVLGRRIDVPTFDIPNGVWPGGSTNLQQLRADTSTIWHDMCARWPALSGSRIVLFLARLAEQKAPEILVEAFGKALPKLPADVTLLMAGPDYGDEALAQSKCANQPWSSRVVFTGGLYGPQKQAALSHSEVFALPSRHEGFSVAVLEAMRHELPCIITPACHFARAAEANAAEIVPGDADEFASALIRVLHTPGRSSAMGLAARNLVESEYTWPRVASMLQQMYAAVLK